VIRNPEILAAFERELARRERPDRHRNLAVYEAMYAEAVRLGVLPPRDPLDGIDVDIRLARALNVRTPA
jgi:hypothetical protein